MWTHTIPCLLVATPEDSPGHFYFIYRVQSAGVLAEAGDGHPRRL